MDDTHPDHDSDGAQTAAAAGPGAGAAEGHGGVGGEGVELPGYLAEALTAIRAGVADVLQARPAALTSGQARRLIREVTAVSAQLYGAHLHSLRVLTDHPDTPPARAGQPNPTVKTYLTSGLHLDPAHATRDLTAARLLDPDTGDLPAVAAAWPPARSGPTRSRSRPAPTAPSAPQPRTGSTTTATA